MEKMVFFCFLDSSLVLVWIVVTRPLVRAVSSVYVVGIRTMGDFQLISITLVSYTGGDRDENARFVTIVEH